HGKEQVVLIRALDGLLAMSILEYDEQIKKPAAFEEDAPAVMTGGEELELTKTLIDASTERKFDFSRLKDPYTEKLRQLIEAKVAGKEIVAPPPSEPTHVINLMDALKKSVADLQKTEKPPPKKIGASKRKARTRKRKSG